MFLTVFEDILLIFVQLGLESFWKIVKDPPFIGLVRVSATYEIC